MTILAIETSSQWCSVAIFFSDTNYRIKTEAAIGSASQLILPWVQSLLDELNISLGEIDLVAVSQGPGAFTGIRLGVGVAQGLAESLQRPLIPVVSLDAIVAQYLFNKPDFKGDLVVMIDARMNQLYWARYRVVSSSSFTRATDVMLSEPSQIDLQGVDCVLGNGIDQYKAQFPQDEINLFGVEGYASALGVAILASRTNLGKAYPSEQCQPLYVRDKVAQTIQEREINK